MKGNNLYLIIAGAVVLAGGSFYGGMLYQKSQQPASAQEFLAQRMGDRSGFQQGGMRRTGGTDGSQVLMGDVVSADDSGVTLKLQDEGSKVVLVSSSTSIGKMTEGSLEDLSEGTAIVVTGSSNSDGSVTATTIQIRPEDGMGYPGGGMMRPSGTPPEDMDAPPTE